MASNEAAGLLKSAFQSAGTDAFHSASLQFNNMIDHRTNNENIRRVAFVQTDAVTFGRPVVESSAEAQLKIPKHISDLFDVYLIRLAMTWRQLPHDYLDSLVFSVKMPTDAIAFDLMPFRYGMEVKEKEGIHVSPGVEVEGVKVELGEVYGREISFKYLKPIIEAYGLQENQFSWTMRGPAVQPGAELFICVVGVPKSSKQLTLAMSASAHWSESFVRAAGLENSEDKLIQVPLH
jgi:hypothetical protein